MKKKDVLTLRQEELLNYLWDFDEPLTTNEMAERLEEKGWNSVTLAKTVHFLSDNGYLKVVGVEKSVKSYARKLVPSISREEYYISVMSRRGIGINSIGRIATAMIDAKPKMSKKERTEVIAQLEAIINSLSKNGKWGG